MTVKEAKEYIKEKEFAEGSMLPKVEACIDFASRSKGYALITSLKKAKFALEGKTGTVIRK
jgi:carbamate kinase